MKDPMKGSMKNEIIMFILNNHIYESEQSPPAQQAYWHSVVIDSLAKSIAYPFSVSNAESSMPFGILCDS